MTIRESELPYIVSGDAEGLMKKWGKISGYEIPDEDFFHALAAEMHDGLQSFTGHQVKVIDQTDLRQGMEARIADSSHPVVSLDRAYFSDEDSQIVGHIDVTRAVAPDFSDLGLRPRPGALPIEQQLDIICSDSDIPITLIDDVIFNGQGVVDIAQRLKALGRPVKQVIAGIAIAKGVGLIEKAGIEVVSVYGYDTVVDEVCERDFLAGIPMSGRTVYDERGSYWSAPYLKPFGLPEKWASIPPESVVEFSRFCLAQSVELWEEVEVGSGRVVTVGDLPRRLNLPGQEDVPVQDALMRLYKSDLMKIGEK